MHKAIYSVIKKPTTIRRHCAKSSHFPSFLDSESSDKNNHFFCLFLAVNQDAWSISKFRVPSYGKTLNSDSSVTADSFLLGMLGRVYR
jgi:hypothetical protein